MIREGLERSSNERAFILQALRLGTRTDGRGLNDMRRLAFTFARAERQASAELQLGHTRVLAVVAADVVPPWPDRPAEGLLAFNVEIGPMATAGFVGERTTTAVEVSRVIERGVRDSQAIDTEALCIVAGERVWQIRVDIHVLDHGGNLIDAAALATMAALQHFRRPEVTVGDGGVAIVHHTDEKEPAPLPLHHVPLCITFALFEDARPARSGGSSGSGGGALAAGAGVARHYAMDPTDAEEDSMSGRVTFALNAHGELCTLHKNGGAAMPVDAMLRCARLAADKVRMLHAILSAQLAAADAKAADERQRRLRGTALRAGGAPPTTPLVAGTAAMPVDAAGAAAGASACAAATATATMAALAEADAAAAAAAEAAAAPPLEHLEYAKLHEAAHVREADDPVRAALSLKTRGLDPSRAAQTELFAAMGRAADRAAGVDLAAPKAAACAVASGQDASAAMGVGGGEDDELDALLAGGAPPARAGAAKEPPATSKGVVRPQPGQPAARGARKVAASRAAAAAAAGGPAAGSRQDGQNGFPLPPQSPAATAVPTGAAADAAGTGATAGDAMAVVYAGSDDEEEAVTLHGEFAGAAGARKGGGGGIGDVWKPRPPPPPPPPPPEKKEPPAPAAAARIPPGAADRVGGDDLLSAVKRKPGKGGKARRADRG